MQAAQRGAAGYRSSLAGEGVQQCRNQQTQGRLQLWADGATSSERTNNRLTDRMGAKLANRYERLWVERCP